MNVSQAVVDQLARTRGWALFFAVLLWLGAGGMAIGGIVMLCLPLIGGAIEGGIPGLGEVGILMGMGVLYLILAIAYIFPALKLTKFASKISNLVDSPNEPILVEILNEQRAFWKFVGILTIVGIVLYFVIVIAAIAIPAVAGAAAGAAGP